MKSDFKFCYQIRVRFIEADMQGIVFNGHYLTYFDVAWIEYFRSLGIPYNALKRRGVDVVLARTTLEFKAPARFDDLLEVYARVTQLGDSSIMFDFEVYKTGDDHLIAFASTLYVLVDTKTLKPIRIFDDLRSLISKLEGKQLLG